MYFKTFNRHRQSNNRDKDERRNSCPEKMSGNIFFKRKHPTRQRKAPDIYKTYPLSPPLPYTPLLPSTFFSELGSRVIEKPRATRIKKLKQTKNRSYNGCPKKTKSTRQQETPPSSSSLLPPSPATSLFPLLPPPIPPHQTTPHHTPYRTTPHTALLNG